MTSETKICPYCAEEIKVAAIVCKHCGREQPGHETNTRAGPVNQAVHFEAPPEVIVKSNRKPWIGGLGLAIAGFGCILSLADNSAAWVLFAIGLIVVIYAIVTGNMKFVG